MFKKNTLNLNNPSPLSIIEDDGVFIHREPIKVFYQLQVSNLITNQPYRFSLSKFERDLLPITLIGYSTTNINQNDNLFIKIYEDQTYLWGLNIANKKNIDTTGFFFSFPVFPIDHSYTVEITSGAPLTRLIIFCEPIFIENEMIKTD